MNFEEWKKAKISREEESKLPQFNSHLEAREYFKSIYGEKFQMQDSKEYSGEKIYFYHLILDMNQYLESVKEISKQQIKSLQWTKEGCVAERYMFSYQPIEISESGDVHIIH